MFNARMEIAARCWFFKNVWLEQTVTRVRHGWRWLVAPNNVRDYFGPFALLLLALEMIVVVFYLVAVLESCHGPVLGS